MNAERPDEEQVDPDEEQAQPEAAQETFRVRRVVRPPSAEPASREISVDETDLGWGDRSGRRDDDWYRRERPPHHG